MSNLYSTNCSGAPYVWNPHFKLADLVPTTQLLTHSVNTYLSLSSAGFNKYDLGLLLMFTSNSVPELSVNLPGTMLSCALMIDCQTQTEIHHFPPTCIVFTHLRYSSDESIEGLPHVSENYDVKHEVFHETSRGSVGVSATYYNVPDVVRVPVQARQVFNHLN